MKERSRGLMYTTAELFYSEQFNLGQLFKIPYKHLTDLIYALSKDVHISYDDFNNMPWYEILMIVEAHNDFIDKQNNGQDEQGDMIAQQQAQMQSMYSQQQRSMPKYEAPKMPDMSSFNSNFNFNH